VGNDKRTVDIIKGAQTGGGRNTSISFNKQDRFIDRNKNEIENVTKPGPGNYNFSS